MKQNVHNTNSTYSHQCWSYLCCISHLWFCVSLKKRSLLSADAQIVCGTYKTILFVKIPTLSPVLRTAQYSSIMAVLDVALLTCGRPKGQQKHQGCPQWWWFILIYTGSLHSKWSFHVIKSSTSLFHSKENAAATRVAHKETTSTCIKDSPFTSAQ